jgi:hypothetical protein
MSLLCCMLMTTQFIRQLALLRTCYCLVGLKTDVFFLPLQVMIKICSHGSVLGYVLLTRLTRLASRAAMICAHKQDESYQR